MNFFKTIKEMFPESLRYISQKYRKIRFKLIESFNFQKTSFEKFTLSLENFLQNLQYLKNLIKF